MRMGETLSCLMRTKKPGCLLIFKNLLRPLNTSYIYDTHSTFQRYDYDECDVTAAKIVAAHVKLQMANNKQ